MKSEIRDECAKAIVKNSREKEADYAQSAALRSENHCIVFQIEMQSVEARLIAETDRDFD